jgi:demethylmenaquinone methyltransferase/2-methoxy-6-polyprenyl-1,4-benzoquinol methylase
MISTDPPAVSPAESPPSPAPPAWDKALLRNPHAVADKRRRVRQMFAAIAPSYDLNNRLHSLWQDQRWRRQAVKMARLKPEDVVLDVACGTGDLALRFARSLNYLLGEPPATGQVMGVDFTFEMLPLAREKALRRRRKILSERCDPDVISAVRGTGPDGEKFCDDLLREPRVLWVNGDAQALPLPDACCDVVSIAFGIRNVADPAAAVREFHRVLRPGGRLIILEFSLPTRRVLRALYNFYFRQVLPRTATLISGDRSGAYKYLPESVNTFIGREQMEQLLREAGFDAVKQKAMTFGVCVCYRGVKE